VPEQSDEGETGLTVLSMKLGELVAKKRNKKLPTMTIRDLSSTIDVDEIWSIDSDCRKRGR